MDRTSFTLLVLMLVVCLPACAKRSRPTLTANDQQSAVSSVSAGSDSKRININTGSIKELEDLPGIGKGLAERIVQHREKYGPFRRPQHLIMVRGISERRFRALQNMIMVE